MLSPSTARHTPAEVRRVPLTHPEGVGGMFRGVPHKQLLDELLSQSRERGFDPHQPVCHLSRQDFDLAASVRLSPAVEGIYLSVGVTTSNAKRGALRWYYGGWVVETPQSWGFAADGYLGGRHTTNLIIEVEIEKMYDRFVPWTKRLPGLVRRLKSRKPSPAAAIDAVARLRDSAASVLPEFEAGDQSSWSLLAACGKAAARVSPVRQLDCLLGVFHAVNSPREAQQPAEVS